MPESILSTELLSILNAKLSAQLGIHYSPERLKDLDRHVRHIAKDLKFKHAPDCLEWLINEKLTAQQLRILAPRLTVGETYFFRDQGLFNLLETEILPNLIQSRRNSGKRLFIWSAGCASGEEPYSIAILLTRLLPDLADWNIRILATDLNHLALAKAKAGTYTKWSMRACPPLLRTSFFSLRPEGTYDILPDIKPLVEFRELNLVDFEAYRQILNHGLIDIILCRNVFIYFTEETAHGITSQMQPYLASEGCLFVSPNELSAVSPKHFKRKRYAEGTYFSKGVGEDLAPPTSFNLQTTRKPRKTVPTEVPITLRPKEPVAAERLEEPKKPEPSAPKDLGNSYDRARSLVATAAWEEVIALLLPLHERGLYSAESAALLSQAYANQNNLPEALHWNSKVIEKDSLNASHYYHRATILAAQDDTEQAINALRQSLYLNPDNAVAHFTIANHFKKAGQASKAGRHLKIAQSLLLNYKEEDLVAYTDGLTVGNLTRVINELSKGYE